MAYEAIQVLVGNPLTAGIGIGETGRRAQHLIGSRMRGKFPFVARCYRLDPHCNRFQRVYDRSAGAVGCLDWNFGKYCLSTFAFNHADDRLFLSLSDDDVELSAAHFVAGLDPHDPFRKRSAIRDVASAIFAASRALAMLLLTTHMSSA